MALPTVFTSGDVFTAANANLLRSNQYNLTTSTKTANYVLVAADVGTRVLMNAAGSTTITVNTSLFAAGDTLEISNIGAGVCTITSGTCTVTSSSNLALPQYASGTLFFTSASAAIFIASAVTATSGALVRVGGGSVGTGASVQFTSVFSSTYAAYRIIGTGLTHTAGSNVTFVLDGITSGYYAQRAFIDQGATAWTVDVPASNAANSGSSVFISTPANSFVMDLFNPNLAVAKQFSLISENYSASNGQGRFMFGQNSSTTQATGITFTTTGGTLSGGRIDIYGYSLS